MHISVGIVWELQGKNFKNCERTMINMFESEMLVNFNRCLEPLLQKDMKILDSYNTYEVLNMII